MKPTPAYDESCPVDAGLVAILRCPVTGAALRWAEPEELARVQRAASAGRLRTWVAGAEILPFQHSLVCESGEICYPVRDGLPFLLKEQAFYLPPP